MVRLPSKTLLAGNEFVKNPPLEGKLPVSLIVPLIPVTVPLMLIPRPLKLGGFGVGVGLVVGVGVAVGVGVGVGTRHRARTLAAWNVLAARNLKSTARFGSIGVKVTVTGLNVPGVNAGILTIALIGVPMTVKDCNPVPALT